MGARQALVQKGGNGNRIRFDSFVSFIHKAWHGVCYHSRVFGCLFRYTHSILNLHMHTACLFSELLWYTSSYLSFYLLPYKDCHLGGW